MACCMRGWASHWSPKWCRLWVMSSTDCHHAATVGVARGRASVRAPSLV